MLLHLSEQALAQYPNAGSRNWDKLVDPPWDLQRVVLGACTTWRHCDGAPARRILLGNEKKSNVLGLCERPTMDFFLRNEGTV